MLRALPRATQSSLMTTRSALRSSSALLTSARCTAAGQQHGYATAHAISNPTLAGIEKRWETMPPEEQANLWMALRDRMKNDWHELTLQERKAGRFMSIF